GNPEGAGNGAGQGDPWPPGMNVHANLTMISNWCERCAWGIWDSGSVAVWTANAFTGDTGPCDPAVIDNITWSKTPPAIGGTATVTTHHPHNIPTSKMVAVAVTNVTAGDNNAVRIWVAGDYTGILFGGDRVRIQGVTGSIGSYVNAGDDGTGLWSVSRLQML